MTAISEIELLGLIEAVRHVPAAVAIVDAAGDVVYENERAQTLAQGPPGAVLPDELAARTIRSGEHVVDAEDSHIRSDGGRAFTRWSSSPIRDAAGRIVAAVVVITDVTAEKGLIKDLNAANPDADALVLSAGLDPASAAALLAKAARLDEIRRDQEHADRQAIETLTDRELEVLRVLAEGLGSQAIARRLHISERTERNHVANILAKLDVHSRLQAVVFSLRYGLVEVPKSAL
jgi:DNA-binding NarL/FixJ family response regulator